MENVTSMIIMDRGASTLDLWRHERDMRNMMQTRTPVITVSHRNTTKYPSPHR